MKVIALSAAAKTKPVLAKDILPPSIRIQFFAARHQSRPCSTSLPSRSRGSSITIASLSRFGRQLETRKLNGAEGNQHTYRLSAFKSAVLVKAPLWRTEFR